MGRRKSEPHFLTLFVKHLIERDVAEGGTAVAIAKRAGVSPPMINALRNGSSVTVATLPGFARAFGYRDDRELFLAAHEFKRTQVAPTPNSERSRQEEAIELAQAYGVTSEQIARALDRFPLADYGHQDALW